MIKDIKYRTEPINKVFFFKKVKESMKSSIKTGFSEEDLKTPSLHIGHVTETIDTDTRFTLSVEDA